MIIEQLSKWLDVEIKEAKARRSAAAYSSSNTYWYQDGRKDAFIDVSEQLAKVIGKPADK